MKRLILGTCLLLLVIGGWLAEAQVPIVRPIPPHTPGTFTNLTVAGQISVTGAGNGADFISTTSINGQINAADMPGFMFDSYASNANRKINSISGTTVVLSSVQLLQNGAYVSIPYAGAATSLTAPTFTSLTPMSTDIHGRLSVGTCSAYTGVTCATNYTYAVSECDALGGCTDPNVATQTITTGSSVLNASEANRLYFTVSPNAVGFKVYECSGSSCTPTLYAAMPINYPPSYITASVKPTPQNYIWYDYGPNTSGIAFATDNDAGTAMPAGATNQWYFGRVVACGAPVASLCSSTTITVSPTVPNTVPSSYHMYVDDSVPINAALQLACQNGGAGNQTVVIPSPYPVSNAAKTIPIEQTIYVGPNASGLTCANVHLKFAGGEQGTSGGTVNPFLLWGGPQTGILFAMYRTQDAILNGANLKTINGNTVAVGVDIDYPPYWTGGESPTHCFLNGNSLASVSGVGIRIANQWGSNLENMVVEDNIISNAYYGVMIGSNNSIKDSFNRNAFLYGMFGIYAPAGTWSARANDVTNQKVAHYYIGTGGDGTINIQDDEGEMTPRLAIIEGQPWTAATYYTYPIVVMQNLREYNCTLTNVNDGVLGGVARIVDDSQGIVEFRNTRDWCAGAGLVYDVSPWTGFGLFKSSGNTFSSTATPLFTGTSLDLTEDADENLSSVGIETRRANILGQIGTDFRFMTTPVPTPTGAVFSEMIQIKAADGNYYWAAVAPGSPTPAPTQTPVATPTPLYIGTPTPTPTPMPTPTP